MIYAYTDARNPSFAPDAHAALASRYGHASHDASSPWHAHGHGAPGHSSSQHVTRRPVEDGSAESRHGAAAGGKGQAPGEGS